MSELIRFKVKIADITIMIYSNFLETQRYYKCFITDEPEIATIVVTMEEINYLKNRYPSFTDEKCEKAVIKYKMDMILVDFGAFPFHASAISYKGHGIAFTALSGVGKTTHAALWRKTFSNDVVLINDDRPYIRVTESNILVCSHPQSGIYNLYSNTNCNLEIIGKVVRDSNNFVKELSKSDFYPFMVQQSFTLDNPVRTGKIMRLIKETINNVYLFEIHCNTSNHAAFEICKQLPLGLI